MIFLQGRTNRKYVIFSNIQILHSFYTLSYPSYQLIKLSSFYCNSISQFGNIEFGINSKKAKKKYLGVECGICTTNGFQFEQPCQDQQGEGVENCMHQGVTTNQIFFQVRNLVGQSVQPISREIEQAGKPMYVVNLFFVGARITFES